MPPLRLFHASEEPDIRLFTPRPVPSPDSGLSGSAVWAVDEAHLPNYLLPRDCPRVTFAAGPRTSKSDKAKFLGEATAARVVALESGWRSRVEGCRLYLYEFPVETFELVDAVAGYYISRAPVAPVSMTEVQNLLAALQSRNIDVRFLANLWELRDAVVESSLEFSVIRWRNAQPLPANLTE